jgi:hypothetical protein
MVVVDHSEVAEADNHCLDRYAPALLQMSQSVERDAAPKLVQIGEQRLSWSQERCGEPVGLLLVARRLGGGVGWRAVVMKRKMSELV